MDLEGVRRADTLAKPKFFAAPVAKGGELDAFPVTEIPLGKT